MKNGMQRENRFPHVSPDTLNLALRRLKLDGVEHFTVHLAHAAIVHSDRDLHRLRQAEFADLDRSRVILAGGGSRSVRNRCDGILVGGAFRRSGIIQSGLA